VLSGQSMDLAPADGKLYALRDVTGTVSSIPLIASSIMSKKIAAGAQAIVLDVKVGNGAFMETIEQARELASLMVSIGELSGRNVAALLSDMNQPLGIAVGNALEVKEAIMTLHGEGPENLLELCLLLGAEMLVLAQRCGDHKEARNLLERNLKNKTAVAKFREMVEAQGGTGAVVEDIGLLPKAPFIIEVNSNTAGYVREIDSLAVGLTAMNLGAGRETKDSVIDLAVGVELSCKVGDSVTPSTPLAKIHANDKLSAEEASTRIRDAFSFSELPAQIPPLLYKKITKSDV